MNQYPDAPQGQYMYAISNERSDPPRALSSAPTPPPTIEVGCINKFGGTSGNLHGVWPNEDNNGLWSEHEKEGDSHNCGTPDGNVGGLVGMDIANLQTVAAVGFYDNYKQSCDFRLWKIVAGGGNNRINVSFATTSFTVTHIIGTGIAGTQAVPPNAAQAATLLERQRDLAPLILLFSWVGLGRMLTATAGTARFRRTNVLTSPPQPLPGPRL